MPTYIINHDYLEIRGKCDYVKQYITFWFDKRTT